MWGAVGTWLPPGDCSGRHLVAAEVGKGEGKLSILGDTVLQPIVLQHL